MNKIERSKKARYPVQTSVSQPLYDRVTYLRNIQNVLISEILEAGCAVIEKKKGTGHGI